MTLRRTNDTWGTGKNDRNDTSEDECHAMTQSRSTQLHNHLLRNFHFTSLPQFHESRNAVTINAAINAMTVNATTINTLHNQRIDNQRIDNQRIVDGSRIDNQCYDHRVFFPLGIFLSVGHVILRVMCYALRVTRNPAP